MTTNAAVGGILTADRVNVTTVLNAAQVLCFMFNCNNQFGAPAIISGALVVNDIDCILGTFATLTCTGVLAAPVGNIGVVTTGDIQAVVGNIGTLACVEATIGDLSCIEALIDTFQAYNITVIPNPIDPIFQPGLITSPLADFGLTTTANLVVVINATIPVLNVTTVAAGHIATLTLEVTTGATMQGTLAVQGITTAQHIDCTTLTATGRVTAPEGHITDIEASQIETGTLFVDQIHALDFQNSTVEIDLTESSIDCHIDGTETLKITGDGIETAEVRTDYVRPHTSQTLFVDGFNLTNIANALQVTGPGTFQGRVTAPNIDSSGAFSHCHVCEPQDQTVDWASLTGRLIESTGLCAVRNVTGTLITDFKQVPGLSYAMPSVRIASTSTLGVLLSVENVLDNAIEHAHGITFKHNVTESDGFKILRVCGAGDCFVWTVRALGSEVPLTSAMVSGLYTKFENGVEVADKVVLTCNSDFSFQMSSAADSSEALATRVAQLEAIVNQLTNNM